jgi:hypothetical protein
MAKGLANGAPIGACVTRPEIAAVLKSRVPVETFGPNADLSLRFTTAPAARATETSGTVLSFQHGTATVAIEVQALWTILADEFEMERIIAPSRILAGFEGAARADRFDAIDRHGRVGWHDVRLREGETCPDGRGSTRCKRKKFHSDLPGESADRANRKSFAKKTRRPTHWFRRRQLVIFGQA